MKSWHQFTIDWHQYATGWADQHGGYDLRRAPAVTRGWLGAGYAVARVLTSLRVPPGALFVLAVGLAAGVPLVAGRGPLGMLAAASLALLSTFAGTLDGALTVLRVGASARGTIRGMAAARLGEAAGLIGFWVAGVPGGLLVGCGALAWLHELIRREALAAGLSWVAVQTVNERPMRMSVVAGGFAIGGLAWLAGVANEELTAGLLTVAAVVWLLLALIGTGQLATIVRRTLR